jgi:hypothetical protein
MDDRHGAGWHGQPAQTGRRGEGGVMGTWFWLNIPLCAVIFSAMVGIPLWMVIKRPDTGHEVAEVKARIRAIPLHAVSRQEVVRWREARWREAA